MLTNKIKKNNKGPRWSKNQITFNCWADYQLWVIYWCKLLSFLRSLSSLSFCSEWEDEQDEQPQKNREQSGWVKKKREEDERRFIGSNVSLSSPHPAFWAHMQRKPTTYTRTLGLSLSAHVYVCVCSFVQGGCYKSSQLLFALQY